MAELKYIKQFLSTDDGTEGSLLIPKKIADTLVGAVDKKLIPRSEAAMFFGPGEIPGSSIDIDLETPNSIAIRLVPEGAEVPLDASEYTSFNLKPAKYGVSIRITREMLEDAKWNLLDRSLRMAGQKFAENETSLIVSDALDNASNTVTGGSAATIANITRAMQYLEDADHDPTSLFVGNEFVKDLRDIDTFVEADKAGNREMMSRGMVGTIYGMNVLRVSSNAGYTTTTAYVTDKEHAYVIAEKRALTVENFDLPSFDMSGAVSTQRLAVRHLRADAIAKITTT